MSIQTKLEQMSPGWLLLALLCCSPVAWSVPGDFDDDGVPDELDADADNDGIPNINEGTNDSDNDGWPNFLDIDSDNDTIPDIVEALKDRGLLFSLDTDFNGQVDAGLELGNNGLANVLEILPDAQNINFPIIDTDDDLVPDYLDLDSDNDGLSDRIEYRNIAALRQAQVVGINDPDGNGLDNSFPLLRDFFDTDGDGIENALDTDSDQDGLSDLLETAGLSFDRDNNGRIDQFLDLNGDGLQDSLLGADFQFMDADGDGVANHQDLDSDNDGLFDAEQAGFANIDGIFVNNQAPQFTAPPGESEVVAEEVTIAPTTNPTATTGSSTVVDALNDSTTNTVTSSSFNADENPIRPSNTTIITGRDGSVFGGSSGIIWLLLLGVAAMFKTRRVL